jgi:tripartite-type tricarboxylate transporter receptor subunit TctC
MKRVLRYFAALAAAASAGVAPARAEWPDKPVRIVVTFLAGGANDIIARLMSDELSKRFGQQFIVDNRVGGGGNIGAEYVVRAAPDGYTFLQATAANATNASLYPNLNFNFLRDVDPVAGIYGVPLVLVTHSAFPAKNVAEFVAYAKARPGKVNYASGGIGTVSHIVGEMMKLRAGIDMVHVPYRGSPAVMTDLIGQRIEAAFDPLPTSLQYIREGKLIGIGITPATRSEAIPDVQSIGETIPGFEANPWIGLAAPKGTPDAIIRRLNAEVNAVLATDAFKTKLRDLGASPLPMTPEAFGALMKKDTEQWGEVIRAANIKAE